MSSYLENLVNRINQQGAIARPRTVALFEPATPGDFSTWTDVDQPARISTDFQQTPEPGSFPTLKLRPGNTNPVEIRFESPRPAKTIQPPIAPLTDQPAKPVIAPISEAAALHPGRLALEPEAQPAQAPLGRVPAFQKVSPVIQRSLSATPVSVHMPGNDPDSPPMPEQDRPPGSQQAPSIQPAPIPKPKPR